MYCADEKLTAFMELEIGNPVIAEGFIEKIARALTGL
jgi:hypothetical protein